MTPPGCWFIFLDGSLFRDPPQAGSAAVVVSGLQSEVLCFPCPALSSKEAEFWAFFCTLAMLQQLPCPPQTVLFFSDNKSLVHASSAQQFPRVWQQHLEPFMPFFHSRCYITWIKAHVGFLGNEIADAFAKWVSFLSPCLLPSFAPPNPHTITQGALPIVCPLCPAHFLSKLPQHDHHSIHPIWSFLWWKASSPFSVFPFLWSHALLHSDICPLQPVA